MRTDLLERKEEILEWIENKDPKAEMARRLKCKIDTLNSFLKREGIEYSGNQNRKGRSHYEQRSEAKEYLGTDKYITSHALRIKLIEDGLKEAKCENCGLSEWMGEPIPLELHHINGDHYDNRLENLQILCPNCHAQTSTFSKRKD